MSAALDNVYLMLPGDATLARELHVSLSSDRSYCYAVAYTDDSCTQAIAYASSPLRDCNLDTETDKGQCVLWLGGTALHVTSAEAAELREKVGIKPRYAP
jgi:hypothetical protein